MNDSTPRSKAVRSRATKRLRTFTIGTTLAGFAASAGFAWLAAATYDGTAVTAANAAGSTTTTTTTADSTVTAPSATSGTTGSSSGVSRSSRRAHVSTGGS